ncbi:MAG: DMT family transporter [Desulfobacteraceae bacterium]|nr:MAG: DMT family transporter [Desulfobacteraceae bacterium]
MIRSSRHPASAWVTVILTVVAMTAFAANSIFCRLALKQEAIDALSFTTLRISSGAAALGIFLFFSATRKKEPAALTVKMASMLVTYALTFSLAYLSLPAGTGALILFGAVQTTMITAGVLGGERLSPVQWIGFLMAILGFIGLALPGLGAPPLQGALLMALAGMAWGFYSLMGKKVQHPSGATALNFIYAVPLVCLFQAGSLGMTSSAIHITPPGVLFAILSGTLASGAGYVTWYAALKSLSASKAAIVQLTVPVIAATGGLLFLGEPLSWRLVVCGMIILTGVGMAITSRQ